MKKDIQPYVISDDVPGLLERWTLKNNLTLPKNGLFKSLRDEMVSIMSTYFTGGIEVVTESDIRKGMKTLMCASESPVISLDRAYISEQNPHVLGFIDLTRGVNEDLEDIGIRPRPGSHTKEEQLKNFYSSTVEPVTLVDDVIFNGDSVVMVANELAEHNRPVKEVIAGIGIEKGIKLIESNGIEVHSVYTYKDVVDEVCMRDFYPGVPLSGRSVYSPNGKIWSAPYIRPFGDPEGWASIPAEYVGDFSRLCIEHAVTIWSAIECASDTKIPNRIVPRKFNNMQDEQSIVHTLKNVTY